MTSDEQRLAAYEAAVRAKYSDDDRKKMAGKEAMPDGSYPIKDSEDLSNAIHAVGRGKNNSHNAIRRHIMARAKALGLEKEIPDGWNSDGSLTESESTETGAELRAEDEVCDCGGEGCPSCETEEPVEENARARAFRKKPRHRAVPVGPEVRFWRADNLEIREQSSTNEIIISGAPIVYDQPYQVVDMFGAFQERMAPGVANDILSRGADVRFLFNHDGLPMARSKNDLGLPPTMTLADTDGALRFEARLDARQQIANDLSVAIERGDVSQMSCGFIVARDEWDAKMENRTIYQFADLLDVSAVTYPASPTTSIEIARRMAWQMAESIPSGARARQFFVDARAGKSMSAGNAQKVLGALHTLHSALGSAGVDVSSLYEEPNAGDEQDIDDVNGVETGSGDSVSDDGTDDGGAPGIASVSGQDGTNRHQDDPGEKMRDVPETAAERRDAQTEKFKDDPVVGPIYEALLGQLDDVWIVEATEEHVIFRTFGEGNEVLWRAAHEFDDDEVTVSGIEMVRVEYAPVEAAKPKLRTKSWRVLKLELEERERRRFSVGE